MPRLQRQLQKTGHALEDTVSPALAAGLRRIAPSREDAPSAAGLRAGRAVLSSWAGSLTIEMLSAFAGVRKRPSRQPTAA